VPFLAIVDDGKKKSLSPLAGVRLFKNADDSEFI